MQDESGIRRAPQQLRSQNRVDAILEAAATMIDEVGYEGVTTSKLARQVGIPIGSFYQFFANKEAVFQALGERYLAGMRAKIDAMFPPDAHYAPLPVLVGRAVDLLVVHTPNHARLHQLMESGWMSPEMRTMGEAMGAEIVQKIGELLAHKAPQLADDEREIAATVMMHLVKGVSPAVEGRTEPHRSAIIEEFKRLGVMYMQSVIDRQPAPNAV
jgi:AcrR family transcriptional regulator